MKKLLLAFLVPIFGLFLSFGVIEVVIRIVTAKPKTTWSDRPTFYYAAEGRPTMQGMPYETKKPLNRFRIAVIGDSFTFAPYMQFNDTFPAKLEDLLNLNLTDRRVEVINYGVPAYSTSHEIRVIEKAIQEGADLIILQVTLNDPELKAHTPTGIREDMDDRFGALKLSPTMKIICKYWRTLAWVLERLHNTKTHTAYKEYFIDLFDNQKTWVPYKNATTKIATLGKSANLPIIAVVFPLFGLPFDKNYPFYAIHQKVADLFKQLNIAHLDLSDIYKDIPLERMQVIPGVDRHPNEIAHRMAAEAIYTYLEAQKLIPEEFLVKEKYATRLGIEGQKRK